MKFKHLLLAAIFFQGTTQTFAQLGKGIDYSVEGHVVVGGNNDYAPFWLTANQYGLS